MNPTFVAEGARAPVGFYFIYFYGTEDGSEVKIGHTKQAPTDRRHQHENQAGNHLPMRTLAVVLGQLADESELKRYFRNHRSRLRSKEWISGSETMRSYLRWLIQQPFIARTESEAHRLVPVDGSEWLPMTSRHKQPRQLRLEDSGNWDDPWADLNIDHVTEGDFYTSPTFIEPARKALGGITLDPASCAEANVIVKADRFYSFHENGLLEPWKGRVWLNPPFGNWQDWAPKALKEWRSGEVEAMCLLATTRVLTAQVFHPIVAAANAVFLARGRVPFWGPKASSSPDEGHVIFYFGAQVQDFREAFKHIGTIYGRLL